MHKLNRFRAFGWHLLFSLLVATLSAAIVFFVWYPGLLAHASNVINIYFLLLIVDICLGPLITFIVFDVKKKEEKELKRDILIISALQIFALMYGLHALYITRPVFVVYNEGRFDVVSANEISDINLKKSRIDDFKELSRFGPQYVAATLPENIKERNDILFDSLSGGDDISRLPQYYKKYYQVAEDVKKRSESLEILNKLNTSSHSIIQSLQSKYTSKKINAGYLPLKGRVNDLTVIVDRSDGTILEMVDLNPWNPS